AYRRSVCATKSSTCGATCPFSADASGGSMPLSPLSSRDTASTPPLPHCLRNTAPNTCPNICPISLNRTFEKNNWRMLMMDVEQIRAVLPHRFPMLLVDRILELEPGKRAVGLKNVTINEDFFNGHFPGQAMMPG